MTLNKNSYIGAVHKRNGSMDIGHLIQPDPNVELYYVYWDSYPTYTGAGFTLDTIEKNLLDDYEERQFKMSILNSEKELLEFRIRYG